MTQAVPAGDVRLTELTACGGCAAKWGASGLSDLVAGWGGDEPDDLLVGLAPFDDAAVLRVAGGVALVSRLGVPRLRLSDYSPAKMQRMIQGMCGAQAFFSEAGRAFGLYVVLGSFASRAPLVPQVNDLLASVRIDPLQ